MFGFFKSKNKDKTVTKDKHSDNTRERKKDKASKEEKEAKVALRKGKEEKSAKSIFRKSKSIERVKEGSSESSAATRKSQSFDGRDSGDWVDSDHEPLSHQDSGTTEEDQAALGPHTVPALHAAPALDTDTRQGGEDSACPSSPALPLSRHQCEGAMTECPLSLQAFSTTSKGQDERLKFDSKGNSKSKNIKSAGAISTALMPSLSTFAGAFGYPQSQRNGLPESHRSGTQVAVPVPQTGGAPSSATPLVMKPPLNPRLVAPRGPLATSGITLTQLSDTPGCDMDEGRLTPSPGVVTPPSSPGLPSYQTSSPYQSITNPSFRSTSPDGHTSMLSTPSSSTSSLSSVSARPISPSGRRTPPGPRMGTGSRITSSPTAGRKAVRTNIKTNPTVVSHRAGSRSPVNPSSSPTLSNTSISFIDGDYLQTPPSSPVSVRHVSPIKVCPGSPGETGYAGRQLPSAPAMPGMLSSPVVPEKSEMQSLPSLKSNVPLTPTTKTRLSSSPSPPPKVSFSSDTKPDSSTTTIQRSPSPTVGKSRHSISSMHSLESIPENESDGHTSATSTLEKNSKSRATSTPNPPVAMVRDTTSSKSGVTAQELCHSAPEALSEKQGSPGVTHKRSYSLSPVNEETLSIVPTQNKEDKICTQIDKNVCLTSGTCNTPIEVVKTIDKLKDSSMSNHNTKERDENSNTRKKEYIVKYEKETQNENIKKQVCEGKATTLPLRAAASSSSTPEGKKIGAISALSHLSLRKPVIESLAKEKKQGTWKTEVQRTTTVLNAETPDNKTLISGEVKDINKNSGKTPINVENVEAATLPLCRSSLTNSGDKELRVLVEILPEEGGGASRNEKEYFKDRPRSISTPRELRREKSDIIVRRRLESDTREERRKDGTKERVRYRSFSSRRHRSQRDQKSSDMTSSPHTDKMADNSAEDIIVPWRRRPRSRSRVSESSSEVASINTSLDPNDKSTAISKGTKDSSTHQKEKLEITKQNIDTFVTEGGIQVPSVTVPPRRQRSKTRDMDRRKTRSVTMSEIQLAHAGVHPEVKEQQDKRRARSSSRISETTHADLESDVTKSQRPTRRRSFSSTSRRSSGVVMVEREDSVTRIREQVESGVKETVVATLAVENYGIQCTEKEKENNSSAINIDKCANEGDQNVAKDKEEKKSEINETHGSAISNLDTVKDKDDAADGKDTEIPKSKHDERRNHKEMKIMVKRSVEMQTQPVQSASILCQTEGESEAERQLKEAQEEARKELAAQEERYQKQVDQLTLTLAQSQEEVSKLTHSLETLRGAQDTLKQCDELTEKLSLLQQDVRDRNAQLDCVRSELQYSKNDGELTKAKLKKLEEDLDTARQKNLALQNQITATANCDRTEELDAKIKEMEEKLKGTLEERDKLNKTIEEIETERDEEIKIIQDALDEAAQEREELISTFEKEFQNMTTMNSNREQQLMEDFEWKLREIEKDHKKKLEEKDRKAENTLHRAKRQAEEAEAEFRQKQEKMKNELNAEWEDKLRSECSRLKGELDELHAEEKHLAVESMKVQKEQEIQALKQTWEQRQEEMTKEISKLKDSLTDKDSYYHNEMENQRTTADRDVWELRRKLQRLDEKIWSQQEFLQEKHQDELERVRADFKERVSDLEARLTIAVQNSDEENRAQVVKLHNEEMDHLCHQHRLSMERLREELESEKFQAVEEARVIVSQHLEYVNNNLREQLTEAITNITQFREEMEAVRAALSLREEVIASLHEELAKLKGHGTEATAAPPSYKDSQNSLTSSSDSGSSSQASSNSQDRLSLSESVGTSIESQDDAHKSGCG